ncbi:MAG: GNAT family N-acetyltransferase [Deltaproteobacteria bacterium]|jgi:GNAT superfamily N-acetyltransferase
MMKDQVNIVGYFPGAIGGITTLHATYYKAHWGLDHTFEAEVATELADFIINFDPAKDGLWCAVVGKDLAGSIAIVGQRDRPGEARLRWYIVDPRFHRMGIGKSLIERAITFSRQAGFDLVGLWTFEGLERAQSIYQKNGFRLAQTREVPQWGGMINEQQFELYLR